MSEKEMRGTPKFVESLMKGAHMTIKRAVDGLTEEQLTLRASVETNSILWLVWHLYRAQDFMGSSISGKEQLWTSGGWADRFGMPPDDTGFGHSAQQVADFRPESKLVFDYAAGVRQAFAEASEAFRREPWTERRRTLETKAAGICTPTSPASAWTRCSTPARSRTFEAFRPGWTGSSSLAPYASPVIYRCQGEMHPLESMYRVTFPWSES